MKHKWHCSIIEHEKKKYSSQGCEQNGVVEQNMRDRMQSSWLSAEKTCPNPCRWQEKREDKGRAHHENTHGVEYSREGNARSEVLEREERQYSMMAAKRLILKATSRVNAWPSDQNAVKKWLTRTVSTGNYAHNPMHLISLSLAYTHRWCMFLEQQYYAQYFALSLSLFLHDLSIRNMTYSLGTRLNHRDVTQRPAHRSLPLSFCLFSLVLSLFFSRSFSLLSFPFSLAFYLSLFSCSLTLRTRARSPS